MSDDHAINHAHNREFESELEALVRRYLERGGTCGGCMADALNFYADVVDAARNGDALDQEMALALRAAGRLTLAIKKTQRHSTEKNASASPGCSVPNSILAPMAIARSAPAKSRTATIGIWDGKRTGTQTTSNRYAAAAPTSRTIGRFCAAGATMKKPPKTCPAPPKIGACTPTTSCPRDISGRDRGGEDERR